MALIQVNKNGGLRLDGKKAARASRKSLAAAAGAAGVATTKKVMKEVEEKLTKNELIAALRSKSSGTWTKKHGGGRAKMSNAERIGRFLNKKRARAARRVARTMEKSGEREAKKVRESVQRANVRAMRAKVIAARKAAATARKAAAAQAKAAAEAALAAKRAERLAALKESLEKLINKRRGMRGAKMSSSQQSNLKLRLAKAKKPANVTRVRKAVAKFKRAYTRKAKNEVKKVVGSLNANLPAPPAPKPKPKKRRS